MTEVSVDPVWGVEVWNDSDAPSRDVMEVVRQSPEMAAIVRWTVSTQGIGPGARNSSLFERDRFVTPPNLFDQIRVAHDASESDDVVSGWMETTENLAFSKTGFICADEDEEDMWQQVAEDLDLDDRMREMWREFCTASQVYPCVWWGTKSYRVRGKSTEGVRRKKTFTGLKVPTAITYLDPLKVVPTGNLMFNQDQLCYIADRTEVDTLDAAVMNAPEADEMARQLITGRYKPNDMERRNLANLGIPNPDWLYTLNPKNVFRYTATRPQYQRFAAVRMKAIFELLDMKHQLRQMDRAHLIGGTHFIVLVRKGTDKFPAKQGEVDQLQEQVRTVARVPVIVGDHRLSVEIVTPKVDMTLNPDKYATLDSRIAARLYHMLITSHSQPGAARDDSVKVAKMVARGMEGIRNRMRRSWERNIVQAVMKANPQLTETPKMRFSPHRIELDFDPALAQILLDLYDRGDISRGTMLGLVDLDQEDEAFQKEREHQSFDDIFQTQVPFTAPKAALPKGGGGGGSGGGNTAANRAAGRNQGGSRSGGGAAPGSGQGQGPRAAPKSGQRRGSS